MTALEVLAQNYRAAFLHYLPRREEAALHRGFELGRSAVAEGLSLLDVVRVHHDVLVDMLCQTPRAELPDLATAAAEFLSEVLATSEMTQRGYLGGHGLDDPAPPAEERVQGSPAGSRHPAARLTAGSRTR